jgi:succinate dehydrogenase / fumarate reductase, cytochrome b subunit
LQEVFPIASRSSSERQRPLSPNIQLYRPQLTSVLSIVNRLTGVLLSIAAIALVVWLLAAAAGPQTYTLARAALASWIGRVILFAFTFAFFPHLLGGIRHLVWDTVHGLELGTIYMSGWTVVAASIVMTAVTWIASVHIGG